MPILRLALNGAKIMCGSADQSSQDLPRQGQQGSYVRYSLAAEGALIILSPHVKLSLEVTKSLLKVHFKERIKPGKKKGVGK